jgi:hypothetical protein
MGKHNARAQEESQDQAYAAGQQSMAAAPAQQAPPQSAGVSSADVSRLQELGKLREQGILTDDEFASQKALILGS